MNGQYSIQILHKTAHGHVWRNDLRMQSMGKDFAKGAFFALQAFHGGAIEYRLVKHHEAGAVEVLGEHRTGTIKVN